MVAFRMEGAFGCCLFPGRTEITMVADDETASVIVETGTAVGETLGGDGVELLSEASVGGARLTGGTKAGWPTGIAAVVLMT